MEIDKVRKTLVDVAKIAVPVGLAIYGSVFAFSPATKKEIIERQHGRCADCNRTGHLECHHIIPQCCGGSDSIDNGVALCPNDHLYWDNRTIKDGIMYGDKPLSGASLYLINDRAKFRKAVGQIVKRNRR